MQIVYTYSGRDLAESRRALSHWVHHEFTDGDVDIDPPVGEFRAVIRKGLAQPIATMRSQNGVGISFRRSWHHIRSRHAAVRLLYFINQGAMRVVNSAGSYTAGPGQCAIINADEPFLTRTTVGDRGNFECSLAVVPEHLVLSHLAWARDLNAPFEPDAGHRPVVNKLLDILCFEGPQLSPQTAEPLVEAFLHAVSDSVGDSVLAAARADTVMDRRFADIQSCIQKFLTAPDLSCDRVAAQCGVSPRYVCYVLRARNTSFSELLWSQRLLKAREWLESAAFQRHPIHKIASMAGFKSAAHFSRMFKATFNASPNAFRAGWAAAEDHPATAVIDGIV
jgi:AraC-like DNA-binding protein/mannose-6-phosphate isomerase-like protein (cupin superfamily)